MPYETPSEKQSADESEPVNGSRVPEPPSLPPVLAPPPLRRVRAWPPTIGRAMLMLGIYTVLLLLLGSVFSVVDMFTGNIVGALAGQAMAMILAAVGTVAMSRPVLALDWRSAIHFAGGAVSGRVWVPVLVLFAVGYPWVVQIALVTHILLPMPEFVARLFEELMGTEDQVVPAFVLLTVIAPLSEEFVCRGWLMPASLERWRPAGAIALTALVFGLMHLNPWQFFYATYLGAWLGWIYLRTRSVWPCVGGHAMNNALAWLSSLNSGEPEYGAVEFADLLPWPLLVMSTAGVVLCAIWLQKMTRNGVASK